MESRLITFRHCRWNLFVLYFVPWTSQRNVIFNQDPTSVTNVASIYDTTTGKDQGTGPLQDTKIHRGYVALNVCAECPPWNPTYNFCWGNLSLKKLCPTLLFGFLFHTFWSNYSDLTRPGAPNGGLVREIPLFQENPGWWNIIFCPDTLKVKQLSFSRRENWTFPTFRTRWI